MRRIHLVLLALVACAPKSSVSRIETLEAQVAQLEKEVTRLSGTRTPSRGERPAAPDPEFSKALQQMTSEVVAIAAAGPMHRARELCETFEQRHASALATPEGREEWRRRGRACTEADVVGNQASPMIVEQWYQGSEPAVGGVQLLVFWEVWCPHCKRELPKLETLHQRYAGRLQVVALTKLNRTATEEKVRSFVADNGISFPIAKERSGLMSQAYNVSGVPAAAVVKDGEIIWRGHPARLKDPTIEALLAY